MISVHELTKTFETDGREIVAVDRLSFTVATGETYGLLGPNGAGKTTTVRMILGLLRPTSGYAEVDGLRTSESPDEVKRRVGLVSASAGLYQWLTPREILLFFADLYGIEPAVAGRRLETLTELMGLGRFLDQRCSTLSTGQKQRVQLARALIHDPPIMLLDEPTRGLDVFGSQAIFEYIAHLRHEGRAVIVCTRPSDCATGSGYCIAANWFSKGRFPHCVPRRVVKRSWRCSSGLSVTRPSNSPRNTVPDESEPGLAADSVCPRPGARGGVARGAVGAQGAARNPPRSPHHCDPGLDAADRLSAVEPGAAAVSPLRRRRHLGGPVSRGSRIARGR